MRALTLSQPWATLVAIGAKRIETRSWGTSYRGPLLIHAAKSFPKDCRELCFEAPFFKCLSGEYRRHEPELLPLGKIVAVCDLVDCLTTSKALSHGLVNDVEREFGNYDVGRFAFILRNVRRIPEPIEVRGYLGLWEPSGEIVERVHAQIREVVATDG